MSAFCNYNFIKIYKYHNIPDTTAYTSIHTLYMHKICYKERQANVFTGFILFDLFINIISERYNRFQIFQNMLINIRHVFLCHC